MIVLSAESSFFITGRVDFSFSACRNWYVAKSGDISAAGAGIYDALVYAVAPKDSKVGRVRTHAARPFAYEIIVTFAGDRSNQVPPQLRSLSVR